MVKNRVQHKKPVIWALNALCRETCIEGRKTFPSSGLFLLFYTNFKTTMFVPIIVIVFIGWLIYKGIKETPHGKSKTLNVAKLLGKEGIKGFGLSILACLFFVIVILFIYYPLLTGLIVGALLLLLILDYIFK